MCVSKPITSSDCWFLTEELIPPSFQYQSADVYFWAVIKAPLVVNEKKSALLGYDSSTIF